MTVIKLLLLSPLLWQPDHSEGLDGRDIVARHWFNNPEYRLHDERSVVLLFFRAERPDKELRRAVESLSRLARRKDFVVIGLTPDSRARAQWFVDEYKVRFTVGAESHSAGAFGIREMPQILLIEGKERDKVKPVEAALLEEMAAAAPESPPDDPESIARVLSNAANGSAQAAGGETAVRIAPRRRVHSAGR